MDIYPIICKCTTNIVDTLKLLGLTKEFIENFCLNDNFPHTHDAVDDAIQCGYYYLRLKLLISKYELIEK